MSDATITTCSGTKRGPVIAAITVPPNTEPGLRLDIWAWRNFPQLASRKAAYKTAKNGLLLLDGQVTEPCRRLHPGQTIELCDGGPPPPILTTLPIQVIFEDEFLAVVGKPPGVPVSGNYRRTLERALPGVLQPSPRPDALSRPRPVHRLDSPTGGLLLVAKTAAALVALGRQFELRQVKKRYRAIVTGRLAGRGCIRNPLDGRDAVTLYCAAEHIPSRRNGFLTLLELAPLTGRTHQLRRHLAALGHPVAGDRQYGVSGRILFGKGLFLWAVSIRFRHPDHNEILTFSLPAPPKFKAYLDRERRFT